MLDVIYKEDSCRVRKDYSTRTLALIRKIVLTVAGSDKESTPASEAVSSKWPGRRIIWKVYYSILILFHHRKLYSASKLRKK
ncbi:MAG: hypothetical protein LBH43_16470 [Treponema sp.]|jgi:hypothetical protein|nr:hypothetical protein [Treponema sp.]